MSQSPIFWDGNMPSLPDILPPFRQRTGAGVNRIFAEQLFDAQELVVFRHAVGSAQTAGLDLAAIGRHSNVGDGRVLGFAGTMRDDGGVSVSFGQFDAIKRLGERADLVQFDENRIGHAHFDAFAQEFRIGHEIVVADELDLVSEFVSELFPCGPAFNNPPE